MPPELSANAMENDQLLTIPSSNLPGVSVIARPHTVGIKYEPTGQEFTATAIAFYLHSDDEKWMRGFLEKIGENPEILAERKENDGSIYIASANPFIPALTNPVMVPNPFAPECLRKNLRDFVGQIQGQLAKAGVEFSLQGLGFKLSTIEDRQHAIGGG